MPCPSPRPNLSLAAVALWVLACQAPSDTCPTGFLKNRACDKKCVVGPHAPPGGPLPCVCHDSCGCWRMPGHSPRPPAEGPGGIE